MTRVLLATEKAFSPAAVTQAETTIKEAGYTFDKLENYKDRSQLLQAVATADAMIIRSDKADKEVIEAAKQLKIIVRAGAGFDNIDLAAASEKGVVAMNTPGMNANAVAELAFGMLVMHARNGFDGTSGRELRGRKLGLVGCGMVGVQMIKIAKGFGVDVFAVDPFLSAEQIRVQGAEPLGSREELFSKCDFVSLHMPCTPETRNSINLKLISSIPKDGVLINTARLEVVDEAGLIDALKARPDLGYISDVQLVDAAGVKAALGEAQFAKQIRFTPKKMGAQTSEANNNCAGAAARQIVSFFQKGDTSCQVNRSKDSPNPSLYTYSAGTVSTNASSVLGAGRKINFGAGPCCLPHAVLAEAQKDMMNWHGTAGMSVMEMSHRGKEFESIIAEAVQDLRDLLNIPSNFKVLIVQGGATAQFAAVPLNLLGERGATADYIVTGTWGVKAVAECDKYGKGNIAATSKGTKFTTIPPVADWKFSPDSKYVHYTWNETVNGVEFPAVPDVGDRLLVCDSSSNFLSRTIDWSKHGVVYAGAQKNVGPAGSTIVVVREDLLNKELPECPTGLSWKTAAGADSMYNTPACYPIYVMGLYLKYVKANGGLAKFDELAAKKSTLLYEALDSSDGYYVAPVSEDCRSRMNVPFTIKGDDAAITKKFLKEADEEGCAALAGHRSVGGCRASIYNAMPLEGVAKLASFMARFRAANP